MFPYYIVRFKPPRVFDNRGLLEEFPYYIVRFKPGSVYVTEPDGSWFPYYIVRFKRKQFFFFFRRNPRFHTT